MSVFGKDGGYIDYTLLKKRGLLKSNDYSNNDSASDKVLDFTSSASSSPSYETSVSSASNVPASNPFDMLSSLANASTSSSSSYSSSIPSSSSSDGVDVSALKIKIEDIEYKLNALIDKIDKLNL